MVKRWSKAANERAWNHLRKLGTTPGTTPELTLRGWERLREIVNAAVGDHLVQRSPDALMLAALLNDILHDCSPHDWMDEFDSRTRKAINHFRLDKQHDAQRRAKEWVREHFQSKRDEYASKTQFAKDYVPLVLDQFGVKVSDRVIAETWLRGLT
jgi:hypothetical protein